MLLVSRSAVRGFLSARDSKYFFETSGSLGYIKDQVLDVPFGARTCINQSSCVSLGFDVDVKNYRDMQQQALPKDCGKQVSTLDPTP